MKKLLFAAIAVFCFQARTSQLAIFLLGGANLGSGRLPSDWATKVNHGRPEISVCSDPAEGHCVHLKSVKASFSLERSVDINPHETPILAWTWKVAELPSGGDFRRAATDDQAAQILVAFADRHVLSYIWDSTAPAGLARNASSVPFVRIFARVCRSGATQINRWIEETRNVVADYQEAFGRPAPRVRGLRLQINSQHTGTVAESYFRDVAFRAAQ